LDSRGGCLYVSWARAGFAVYPSLTYKVNVKSDGQECPSYMSWAG